MSATHSNLLWVTFIRSVCNLKPMQILYDTKSLVWFSFTFPSVISKRLKMDKNNTESSCHNNSKLSVQPHFEYVSILLIPVVHEL